MTNGIYIFLRFTAYALLAAAGAGAALDCAKSVAFTELSFTPCTVWLAWLGVENFFTAQTGIFLRQIYALLAHVPVWLILAALALLFYWLSTLRFSARYIWRRAWQKKPFFSAH